VAYRLIEAERANHDVVRMTELLEVSRSGYYDWRTRAAGPPGPRAQRREELSAAVLAAHTASDGVNGALRITADLRAAGHRVNRKTVAGIMAELQVQGVSPRPWKVTTRPDEHADPHPDLVNRVFDVGRLDAVWISDITYLATGEGWLYLAVVRDACSRRVLGWAIEDHQRAELITAALTMAIKERGQLPEQAIFHADRGSQGEIKRSSQHLDHGGVWWRVRGSRGRSVRRVRGGSGRRIGHYGRQCGRRGDLSRRVLCSVRSGV
jgi:putative transposase